MRKSQRACAACVEPSDQPSWLTADFYNDRVQPALLSVRASLIARTLKMSNSYARDIRNRRRLPHPRHWKVLPNLWNQTSEPSAALESLLFSFWAESLLDASCNIVRKTGRGTLYKFTACDIFRRDHSALVLRH